MNTPGVVLDMPSITERDRQYLQQVSPDLIDFVGLSFVRTARDIEDLRHELATYRYNAEIISALFQSGLSAFNNADDPETSGAAREVPEKNPPNGSLNIVDPGS